MTVHVWEQCQIRQLAKHLPLGLILQSAITNIGDLLDHIAVQCLLAYPRCLGRLTMCALQCKPRRTRMLIFVQFICVTLTVQSVGSQNSINPRRSKSNLTNGVLSCPNIQSKSHSDCKMSCLADEHCENHGDDLKCCPTVPGSNCKAECKEPVLSPNGGKICYDFENDRKYTVGDIFPRDGVCCRCELGGIMNCSAVKSCTQGCYYASAYHNDGDFILGNKCRNCSCHNGVVSCKLNPNCTQDKCKYKGKVYKPDHIIRLDHGCKECVCQSKGWICSAITCNAECSTSSAVSISRIKTAVVIMSVLFQASLITS